MHVLRASNITSTVLLTSHQKSSRWHMKHKNCDDMTSCTFSTTANLPHPSEAYASAHRTSVRGNQNCRSISNKNSMYRSLLKSMTQYKSKHFFFFQTVWNIIYVRLIWFIQRCRLYFSHAQQLRFTVSTVGRFAFWCIQRHSQMPGNCTHCCCLVLPFPEHCTVPSH